jgi:hypothetical protein
LNQKKKKKKKKKKARTCSPTWTRHLESNRLYSLVISKEEKEEAPRRIETLKELVVILLLYTRNKSVGFTHPLYPPVRKPGYISAA